MIIVTHTAVNTTIVNEILAVQAEFLEQAHGAQQGNLDGEVINDIQSSGGCLYNIRLIPQSCMQLEVFVSNWDGCASCAQVSEQFRDGRRTRVQRIGPGHRMGKNNTDLGPRMRQDKPNDRHVRRLISASFFPLTSDLVRAKVL